MKHKSLLPLISLTIVAVFLVSVFTGAIYGEKTYGSLGKEHKSLNVMSMNSDKGISVPLSHNFTLGYLPRPFAENLSWINKNLQHVYFGQVNVSMWFQGPSDEIILSNVSPTGVTYSWGIGIGIWVQGSLWTYTYWPSPTYYNPGVPITYYTILNILKGTKISFQVPPQLNYYGNARIGSAFWNVKGPGGYMINVENPTLFRDAELLAIDSSIAMMMDLGIYGEIPYWVYALVRALEFNINLALISNNEPISSNVYLLKQTAFELLKEYSLSSLTTSAIPENVTFYFHVWLETSSIDLYYWMQNGGASAPINVTITVPVEEELIESSSVIYSHVYYVTLTGTFYIENKNKMGSGGGGHTTHGICRDSSKPLYVEIS